MKPPNMMSMMINELPRASMLVSWEMFCHLRSMHKTLPAEGLHGRTPVGSHYFGVHVKVVTVADAVIPPNPKPNTSNAPLSARSRLSRAGPSGEAAYSSAAADSTAFATRM